MLSGVSICLTLSSKEGKWSAVVYVLAPRQLKGCGSEKGNDPWWSLVGSGGGLVGLVAPPSDMFVVHD